MNGISGRELLKVLCESNGYQFDVQEVTNFQERRLTGPISNRESFRVNFARTDAPSFATKEDIRFLVEMADSQRLIPVCWNRNASLHCDEVRIFSREVFSSVVNEFENIATHVETTFDYFQENAVCVGLTKELRDSVRRLKKIQQMSGDLSKNMSGAVRTELENFIFRLEACMNQWEHWYPVWRTLFKEANSQLYDSFQEGTNQEFLKKIVS